MTERFFECGKAPTAMPAGQLSGEQRGITQKDPAKITFFLSDPTESIPSVTLR